MKRDAVKSKLQEKKKQSRLLKKNIEKNSEKK